MCIGISLPNSCIIVEQFQLICTCPLQFNHYGPNNTNIHVLCNVNNINFNYLNINCLLQVKLHQPNLINNQWIASFGFNKCFQHNVQVISHTISSCGDRET